MYKETYVEGNSINKPENQQIYTIVIDFLVSKLYIYIYIYIYKLNQKRNFKKKQI